MLQTFVLSEKEQLHKMLFTLDGASAYISRPTVLIRMKCFRVHELEDMVQQVSRDNHLTQCRWKFPLGDP